MSNPKGLRPALVHRNMRAVSGAIVDMDTPGYEAVNMPGIGVVRAGKTEDFPSGWWVLHIPSGKAVHHAPLPNLPAVQKFLSVLRDKGGGLDWSQPVHRLKRNTVQYKMFHEASLAADAIT